MHTRHPVSTSTTLPSVCVAHISATTLSIIKHAKNMNLEIMKVAVGVALAFNSLGAFAQTITFDDLISTTGLPISNGYAGLTWNNFWELNGDLSSLSTSGYKTGVVSHSNVAFNAYGNDASFSAATPFTFNSAYLTAAWVDGLSVQVTGYLSGIQTNTSLLTVSTSVHTLEIFNWSNVDQITFHTSGGSFGNMQLAMDNLTISPVPEPETRGLILSGLVLVGVAAQRLKRC